MVRRRILTCVMTWVVAVISGCDDVRQNPTQVAEYERQLRVADEQNAIIDRQLREADAHMRRIEELDRRYEMLLDRWEKHADRTDVLLGEWERLITDMAPKRVP